jgi:hypothetical protein
VLVNVNPLYTAEEMAKQFEDAEPHALVIVDMFADKIPQATRGPPDPERDRDARGRVPAVAAAGDRGAGAEVLGPLGQARRGCPYPAARRDRRGARAPRSPVEVSTTARRQPDDVAVPAIYRGDHGRLEGRDADAREPDPEHGADLGARWRGSRRGKRGGPDRAAALSHLRLHGEPARLLVAWRAQPADPEPAAAHEPQARLRELPHHLDERRQHAVQRAVERDLVPRHAAPAPEIRERGGHGAAGGGGRAVGGDHRPPRDAGLRPDRDLAGPDLQPARQVAPGLHRHPAPLDRGRLPRRGRRAGAPGRSRRDRGAGAADHEGLLAQAPTRPRRSCGAAGS